MAQRFKTAITISELGSAASQAIAANVDGDSNNRIVIDAGGKITWGSGSAAGDTNLYRSAADVLKTDDVFQAVSGIVTLTTSGAPTATLDDGALAVDTTNDNLYLRSGGAWVPASGSASVTVSDNAPSSPSEGDLWFESDTSDIFVYYDGVWVDIGGASVANIAMSDTPPTSPANGDFWFETDTGKTFVYYDDGTSTQWVEVGAASAAATGADGYIQYYDGGTFGAASALVWDSAGSSLDVVGDITATGTVNANLTGNVTGDLTGDVYASDGASKILEAGTNGTDATFTGDVTGDLTGNASTASAWAAARTITLGGDLSGSVSIDGSADVTLSATVAVDSVALGTDTTGDYIESLVQGTGITITNNTGEGATPTIEIGQAVGTTDNVTFNDLTVSGNLTVSGSTTTVDTATLSVEDPLIVLASGNATTDVVDIGFYGLYDTSGSQDLYAGLFRDATDGKFRLFKDSQTVPTTTVDTSATGYTIASLVANIEGSLTGNADTASTWATARTITLGGDLSGSVSIDGSSDVTLTATIGADSVALGTDTTGDYVGSLTQGTGVIITNNSGEGATPTIAIGQSVGTTDTVTFSAVNANLTGNVTGDLTGDVYASDGTSKVLEAGTNGTDATFTGGVTGDLTGNASTASALATARTIQVSGDVAGSASFDGSADINISTTIQANSVALTTDTTGDYVESLVQGTGVTLTNNTGEGSTPTIAIGQSVGTTDSVTFSTVSADLTGDVTGNLIGDVYASDGTSLVLDSGTNGTDATFTGDITGDVTGNASTASAWATARTITLGGDLSGSVSIDGSADVTLSATVAADSVALGTDTTGDYVESLVQGTGITITNNAGEGATPTIAIGQAVGTTDNVTFNDLTVSGNLTVSGSTTTVDTATLSVEDPLIVLASGNSTTDVVDIGFYGLYDTSGSQDLYAGLFRDATDGKFRLFKDSQTVPTTTVDTSATGYTVADLVANVEGTLTGNADSADILSTARTFTLSGDVSGSVSFDGSSDVTISTTIQADSVALGTDTTGDYVESLVAGTGVTLTNNTGESATPTVEIGQAVATTDDVTFNTVTGTNGVITLTSSGAPTSSLSDGAIAIDTTNDTLYIRSNGAWVESSGGASVTVSDAPPSSPTEGDMWFESDTGSTYVYYDSAWVEVGAATSVAVGSEGYIQYYDGGFLAGASAHYWDAANERLGIKNTSPAYEVDVTGTIRGTTIIGSGGVITLATAGAPTASLADGAIAVDTTNDVMYIRSNGAWVESSGGASVTVSDAAPTGAEEGDLWYKSDVGTTLVYYDNTWVEITGSGSSSAYKLMSSSRDAALITMEIGA